MSKTYRIALVGCGNIGISHMEDIYYRENIRIVGVADLNRQAAQFAAQKYNAQTWTTDYRDLIKRNDIDIVIIATNADSHVNILEDCYNAGIHVLCEKPIAVNIEEGKRFYQLATSGKIKVLVSHVLRHNETYKTVKNLIDSGVIGELKVARMSQNHHALDWKRYRRLLQDGSPIIDCAVHYIDILQWFAKSKVIKVSGIGNVVGDGVPEDAYNYGIINMTLENGAIGYYEAGWGKTIPSSNIKEFIGDKGSIRIVLKNYRIDDVEEGDLIKVYDSSTNQYRIINLQSKYKNMWGQMQTLIDMIQHNAPANPTIDEVYSAFCVSVAADNAIKTNSIRYISDMHSFL